ncbi:5670_t:CDS:2, partial [Scutellospora calospora]
MSGMTTRTLADLVHFPNLEFISMFGNIYEDGLGIEDAFLIFTEICSLIRQFTLKECPDLTDNCVLYLVMSCVNLEELTLNGSYKLTDDAAQHIGNYFIELKQSNISDDSLKKFADCCDKLKIVNIDWCFNITGSGVAYLVKKCGKTIQLLSMVECHNVAPDAANLAKSVLKQH